MKTPAIKKLLLISLAVVCCAGAALAQEKEQPKPAATQSSGRDYRENARESYKLDFTFTEMEGGRKVNSRTFTVMCEDMGGRTSGHLRIGSRVPVPTGRTEAGGAMPTQYNYMDVGMKIDAFLNATTDGGLSLQTSVDVTSLAEGSGTAGLPPVLRSMTFSANTGIVPGKAVVLTTADDMGSNRHFEVQVVATKLSK